MTITFKQRISPFTAERLEAISKVLGDTTKGLTGSEIDHLLHNCDIPNLTPDMTKWKRLLNAFVEFQNEHLVGNHVAIFIKRAMDPARYVGEPHVFRTRRDRLNPVLAFCGYTLGDDGQLRRAALPKRSTKPLHGPTGYSKPNWWYKSLWALIASICDGS